MGTLQTAWGRLRNSNIEVAINLNPFFWRFEFYKFNDTGILGRGNGFYKLTLLFLQLTLIIDDGKDNIPDQSGVWDKYEPDDSFE